MEDLKREKIPSFEKILGEVRAVARNKEDEERLLTERIVKDFVEFHATKAEERIATRFFESVIARKAQSREFTNRVNQMKGTDVVLVVQQQYMSKTDLSFSLPESENRELVGRNFLKEEEKKQLDDGDAVEVSLMIIGPCFVECKAWLKKSNVNGYVLIVQKRKKGGVGRIGAPVQLWAFRVKERLFFAVMKLKFGGEDKVSDHVG